TAINIGATVGVDAINIPIIHIPATPGFGNSTGGLSSGFFNSGAGSASGFGNFGGAASGFMNLVSTTSGMSGFLNVGA
ncbi:hypothetical protein INQ28_32695, partial [Escherichia coli]|nr:hypothetical protein [Escherichia coli]